MDRNPRLKNPLKSSADRCHIPRSAREEWLLHFHAQISSFPEGLPLKPLKGKESARQLEFRPEFTLCRRRESESVEAGTCSFSGASHPPEPVDTNLMRPVYVKLGQNSLHVGSLKENFSSPDTSAEDLSIMIKDHDASYAQSSPSSSSAFPIHPCEEDISIMIHHLDKSSVPSSSTSSPFLAPCSLKGSHSPLHGGDSEGNDCIWDSSPTLSADPSPLKSEGRNCGSAKESRGIESWESEKTSLSSSFSDDSSWSDLTVFGGSKPHKGNDIRWKAILAVRSRDGAVGMGHFRLLKRLGCGDIGSVYLSELSGTRCCFAMKVMDKASLESRKKMMRAQTEREILQLLDHPFLPTLYSYFETDRFSCLVMEYCPGGDLHTLRQRQPGKRFSEYAARFYAAEVLLALEYLHMLGVIYRDLKPENVLVRDDGHIMLSDFDLSLRCAVSPTLIKTSTLRPNPKTDHVEKDPSTCMEPACFMQRKKKTKKRSEKQKLGPSVELVAEPTAAKSMSFVGTHEYLAPEIIKGEGHGAAVDWWTFGIFLHELLYGKTPFKGGSNRATLFNVVGQQLKFPESPTTTNSVKELIRGLLVKEPKQRMGMKRGAAEIKQHPFFEGVNWALIRCSTPPEIPPPPAEMERKRVAGVEDGKPGGKFFDFEFF